MDCGNQHRQDSEVGQAGKVHITALAEACQRPSACTAEVCAGSTMDWNKLAESDSNQALVEPLSARQLEILSAICDGDSNQDIGAKLGLANATVKYHLWKLYAKLGVQRRTQAVAIGIHLRLIQPVWLLRSERD